MSGALCPGHYVLIKQPPSCTSMLAPVYLLLASQHVFSFGRKNACVRVLPCLSTMVACMRLQAVQCTCGGQPLLPHHLSHNHNNWAPRTPGVVEVGQPVCQARPKVKQHSRRPACHACVAAGASKVQGSMLICVCCDRSSIILCWAWGPVARFKACLHLSFC